MPRVSRLLTMAVVVAIAWQCLPTAQADYGWEGKRKISYQHSKDLFYNQYVGPGPNGVPAEMNVSPMPVPERVGHTYGTYQPFYPHEYLYRHKRAWYNYHQGAGWTRTNVRYGTGCGWWNDLCCGCKNCCDVSGILDCCKP
ncbi:MAG: hypothetical protein ACR2NU_07895 [Aeoliella sp.]